MSKDQINPDHQCPGAENPVDKTLNDGKKDSDGDDDNNDKNDNGEGDGEDDDDNDDNVGGEMLDDSGPNYEPVKRERVGCTSGKREKGGAAFEYNNKAVGTPTDSRGL